MLFLATVRWTFYEIIFQTKEAFLQRAFDFNAVNHQSSHYNERQGVLKHSLYCQSVNMTKTRI